jgi:hypothetical protein
MPPRFFYFPLTLTLLGVNAPLKRLIGDPPQPSSGGALLQTITESDPEDRKPGGGVVQPVFQVRRTQGRPEEPTEIWTPNDR